MLQLLWLEPCGVQFPNIPFRCNNKSAFQLVSIQQHLSSSQQHLIYSWCPPCFHCQQANSVTNKDTFAIYLVSPAVTALNKKNSIMLTQKSCEQDFSSASRLSTDGIIRWSAVDAPIKWSDTFLFMIFHFGGGKSAEWYTVEWTRDEPWPCTSPQCSSRAKSPISAISLWPHLLNKIWWKNFVTLQAYPKGECRVFPLFT